MATDINENLNTGEEVNSELSLTQSEKSTDWKRRTLELEEQLYMLRERVNSQTGKIREAVSQRVGIYYVYIDELPMSQIIRYYVTQLLHRHVSITLRMY